MTKRVKCVLSPLPSYHSDPVEVTWHSCVVQLNGDVKRDDVTDWQAGSSITARVCMLLRHTPIQVA